MEEECRTSKSKFDLMTDLLGQPKSAQWLAVFYLHCCYAYGSVRRYFEQTQALLASKSGQSYKCTIHPDGNCPPELMSAQQSRNMLAFMHHFRQYQRFSTVYMCLVALRKSLPLELLVELLLHPSLPANCYLLGRQTVFTRMGEGGMVVLVAVLHLIWRYLRLKRWRTLRLDLFGFLMFSGVQIKRESMNIENQIDELRLPRESCIDLRARQLRTFMRLPVETRPTNNLMQTIRPNRTPEAHRQLCQKLVYLSIPVFALFMTCMVLGSIWSIWCLISDRKYLERYPGCNPELERLVESSEVHTWWLSFSWHRLLSTPFDFTDNLVIWFDTIVGCLLSFPIYFILNEDLMISCQYNFVNFQQLELNLAMDNKKKCHYACESVRQSITGQVESFAKKGSICAGLRVNESAWLLESSVDLHRQKFMEKITASDGTQRIGEFSGVGANRHLEQLVHRSQHLIRDFFNQLDAADEYISEYITIFAAIWLGMFVGTSYYSTSSGQRVDFVFRFYQVFLFFTFTVISILLLRLHREAVRSYTVICSILANYRAQNRRKFRRILEFFIGRKQATYTLFHQRPFLASSYMTIISWTLTSAIVLENLVVRGGK